MNSDRNTLFQSLPIWLMSLRRLGALALQLAKNENWKSSYTPDAVISRN
jgi:hypothetical protein